MTGAPAPAACFAPDYQGARERFRSAAADAGASVESIPIRAGGPGGAELAIDAAWWGDRPADRLLVVSSGLHGVEGFLGSAVQVAALRDRFGGREPGKGTAVLLLHALNPYGFAWLRRFDEDNIDLNRNFLERGEPYEGAPPRYRDLDPLLNPRGGGGPLDGPGFYAGAAVAIARWGYAPLRQAVAGGQYEFPRGLFFGGKGPSNLHRLLLDRLPRWIEGAAVIRHLDIHSGLGKRGALALLADSDRDPACWGPLGAGVRNASATPHASGAVAYRARGGFNRWVEARLADRDAASLCAEFGTDRPLRVLAALRAENRAHHERPEGDPRRALAKRDLVERFAPACPRWRARVLSEAIRLLREARAWTLERGGAGAGG